MPIDDESGEFIRPKPIYMDSILIDDPELGKDVPLWKAMLWKGAKARTERRIAEGRGIADSEGEPSHEDMPPIVADENEVEEKRKLGEAMSVILDAIQALEQRL